MAAPKTIQDLINALQSAPQDKEGAFRVATWRMVLEAFQVMQDDLQLLNNKLGIIDQKATRASETVPDTEAIKRAIKDDISKADAQKILF